MVMTCDNIGSKVMSLCVAREMVVPMAMEAKAAREVVVNQHCHDYCWFCQILPNNEIQQQHKKHNQANGLVIIQQGERKCLEQIRWEFTFSLSWFETTDNTIAIFLSIVSSRKAADDMEDPIAIMLKYLNVMGNISTKNNKTLVVPIPKVYYSHTYHVKADLAKCDVTNFHFLINHTFRAFWEENSPPNVPYAFPPPAPRWKNYF